MKKIISNSKQDLFVSEAPTSRFRYHDSDSLRELADVCLDSYSSLDTTSSVFSYIGFEKNHIISKVVCLPRVQLTTYAVASNSIDRWIKEISLASYDSVFDDLYDHTSLAFVKKSNFFYDSGSVSFFENRVLVNEQDIKLFYEFDNKGGFAASAFSVIIMEYYKSQNDFERIESIMSELNASMLSSRSLISILRSTYAFRDLLKTWNSFYEDSYQSMLAKGLDPVRKLRGLKPVEKKEDGIYGNAI